MEIISLKSKKNYAINYALNTLLDGGVIIFPTDTVYGIGGDARRAAVLKRIRQLKKRPQGKPFPWLVSDLAMAKRIARFSLEAEKFAKKHWPGPAILVLPARGKKRAKRALRLPAHPWLRRLIANFGHPVVGTSANISGLPPAKTVKEAVRMLPRVDVAFDGGLCDKAPSLVVDFTKFSPEVLRSRKKR